MLGNFSHFDGEGWEGVSDQMCEGDPDEIMKVEKVLWTSVRRHSVMAIS